MNRLTRVLCFLAVLAFPVALSAQPAPPAPPADPDPLARFLFPPELIMKYQKDLRLTDEQRETIKREAVAVQSRFLSLQWDLQEAFEDLKARLDEAPVDEDAALAQLNTVLDLERQIKQAQLTLGIRLRNALTPDQIRFLRDARRREAHRR